MGLIFKTKRTINFVNSCYKREPRLETFCIANSDPVPAEAAVGAEDLVLGVRTGEARDHHRAGSSCFELLVLAWAVA